MKARRGLTLIEVLVWTTLAMMALGLAIRAFPTDRAAPSRNDILTRIEETITAARSEARLLQEPLLFLIPEAPGSRGLELRAIRDRTNVSPRPAVLIETIHAEVILRAGSMEGARLSIESWPEGTSARSWHRFRIEPDGGVPADVELRWLLPDGAEYLMRVTKHRTETHPAP